MRVKKALYISVLTIGIAFAGTAHTAAETAADFLKDLAGNYSARGSAVVLGNETTRISCRFKNAFTDGSATLDVAGNCASTKGKGEVSGKITARGDQLDGSFVSTRRNMRITKSSGKYQNGKIVLSVSMMDDKVGKLVRVRQQISRDGDGFKAEFFTFDNATQAYKSSGTMRMRPAGS